MHINEALEHWIATALGATLAVAAALLFTAVGRWFSAGLVTVGFLIVLFTIAHRYGTAAGLLGTVAAAVIFATWLYAPLGQAIIESPEARQQLAWIVLGGVVGSFLLAAPRRPASHS